MESVRPIAALVVHEAEGRPRQAPGKAQDGARITTGEPAMSIRCFWLDPTGRGRRSLRRYIRKEGFPCAVSGYGYHNAEAVIDEIEYAPIGEGEDRQYPRLDDVAHDDPRWPKMCACGYAFVDDDRWQTNADVIYKRLDTGEEMIRADAGPGAMWDAWWYRGHWRSKGAVDDGISLMVKCPDKRRVDGKGAEWYVDGPASNGPGWTRSGDVRSANPTVTANPSIGIGDNFDGYHGWLRNGYLTPA